ncbi:MAG: hypothetical protein O2967_05080 [Proteobacteria bacterium]|nr:hypothetical protein [Pseudomonadota bacterium]
MKVLLNGGIARRGMGIPSKRFCDRISLRQIDDGSNGAAMAENMIWAEVSISINYGPELPPAPSLKPLQIPASGLDAIDRNAVPGGPWRLK